MRKLISLTIRNRAAAALVILALLAVGAVFLTVGFALLLGLAVVGGVVGAGLAAYRAIRGGTPTIHAGASRTLRDEPGAGPSGLDPSLQIAAPRDAVVRRADDTGTGQR